MDNKKEELMKIIGANKVLDRPDVLDAYSRDCSFATPRKPKFVVNPDNMDEVQKIVEWANQTNTPLVPISSGPPRFFGDTIPSAGSTVIVDLSEMKRIMRIDRRNRMVIIEPGVTYSQLQPELAKEGLRLTTPLLPRSSKSVLTSLLERQPTIIPKYQWEIPDPLRCLEVVWGNGESMRTGEAGDWSTLEEQWGLHIAQVMPMGPSQVDYYRLIQAAQGTMGIATWASVRCEVLPQLHKLFFVPSERLDDLLPFTYRLLRFRFGDELFILNSSNLAYILGEDCEEVNSLKKELSQWVIIVGIAGRDWLLKERVEFQEEDINDIAQQFGLKFLPSIPGANGSKVLEVIRNPSREPYWKLDYKGGFQDIFFLATLNRTPKFVKTMYSVAESKGYVTSDMGIYIQPVQQGVACHCEFSLPYNPGNQKEVAKVQDLLTVASEELMKQGAFFSRPYGIWADMVYKRDTQSTAVLRKIKGIFDPNNVMNPGKLCF